MFQVLVVLTEFLVYLFRLEVSRAFQNIMFQRGCPPLLKSTMIYSRGEINARSALQHPPGGFHPPPLVAGSAFEESNKTIDLFERFLQWSFQIEVMKK